MPKQRNIRAPYTLGSFIGRGAQGECWQILEDEQIWLGKWFHLQDAGWDGYDQIEREATLLQQLKHPGIPSFKSIFVAEDLTHIWLLREWIPGDSLEHYIEKHRCGEEEARHIAREVASILQYIHTRSPALIHRDIKPSNIIIRPDQQVTLIDFGSVRDAIYTSTQHSVMGTYGYTPPEQFLGHPTLASDLYALGATLIHLLARCSPSTLPLQRNRLQFDSYIHVSPRFRRILRRLLEPEVEERFQSAQELLDALDISSSSVSSQTSTTPIPTAAPKRVEWQRNRSHLFECTWEHIDDPARTYPRLEALIQLLIERYDVQGLDRCSDPLELVEAIDAHWGKEDETGRMHIVRLLHPYEAADLLLSYYTPDFILPLYAQTWKERFSLLFTHSEQNSIGQWIVLYFLYKYQGYTSDVLQWTLPVQEFESLGLLKQTQRFLKKFEGLSTGKQAQRYTQLMTRQTQLWTHFQLCCSIPPESLKKLVIEGFSAFENTWKESLSPSQQAAWKQDSMLRWSLRFLTLWPPYWLRFRTLSPSDFKKLDRLGMYIAEIFRTYQALDAHSRRLQEEYSWLLPDSTSKQITSTSL